MTIFTLDLPAFVFAAALVLLLPGAALLAWLPVDSSPSDRYQKPAFAASVSGVLRVSADILALSISLSALVGMLQFFAGLRFSGWALVGLYALCGFATAGAVLARRVTLPRWGWKTGLGAGLLALGLVALWTFWRFYQARDLTLSPWVDPVHHTLLVRQILEYRGLPPNYLPYVDAPFFYHYGFHLMAALFAFWSNFTPDQAVLWFGQALNAAVALSVFRAVDGLGRPVLLPGSAAPTAGEGEEELATPAPVSTVTVNLLRGLAAALLVTFTFQMPAYYLTWGRYTLIAGLLLLGPFIAAVMEAVHGPNRAAARIRAALLIAGMSLTHYFALLLAGLFIIVLGISRLVLFFKNRAERLTLIKLAAWAAFGLFLALPWIVLVWQHNQQQAAVQVVSPFDSSEAAQTKTDQYLRYLVDLTGPRRNHLILGMTGVGLLVASLRPGIRLLAAWGALLALFSLPWGLRFGPFRPDYFAIILFFPAAILLAELLTACGQALAMVTRPRFAGVVLALLMAAFVFWGVRETRNIVNPVTVFVNQADVAALDWVAENTPGDARFYINSTHWLTIAYRGVDGGYWLTPYTGRGTLIPQVYYLWGTTELFEKVTSWGDRSAQLAGCGPDFWQIVREANLTHLYLKEGQGSLQPAMLQECPRLLPVYQKDGVFIYEIVQP